MSKYEPSSTTAGKRHHVRKCRKGEQMKEKEFICKICCNLQARLERDCIACGLKAGPEKLEEVSILRSSAGMCID